MVRDGFVFLVSCELMIKNWFSKSKYACACIYSLKRTICLCMNTLLKEDYANAFVIGKTWPLDAVYSRMTCLKSCKTTAQYGVYTTCIPSYHLLLESHCEFLCQFYDWEQDKIYKNQKREVGQRRSLPKGIMHRGPLLSTFWSAFFGCSAIMTHDCLSPCTHLILVANQWDPPHLI